MTEPTKVYSIRNDEHALTSGYWLANNERNLFFVGKQPPKDEPAEFIVRVKEDEVAAPELLCELKAVSARVNTTLELSAALIAGELANRRYKAKLEALDPKACKWVTIHGHPVCIHPKSGNVAVPSTTQPQVLHFNKAQSSLFYKAMEESEAWIEGEVLAREQMYNSASAERELLKSQGALTAENVKAYLAYGATMAKAQSEMEALTHAHNVTTGLAAKPEAPVEKPAATAPVKQDAKEPPVELSKTLHAHYSKVLSGLQGGKITPSSVETRNDELAALATKTKAEWDAASGPAKKLLSAKVSRANQEIQANGVALKVYAGAMEPPLLAGAKVPAVDLPTPEQVDAKHLLKLDAAATLNTPHGDAQVASELGLAKSEGDLLKVSALNEVVNEQLAQPPEPPQLATPKNPPKPKKTKVAPIPVSDAPTVAPLPPPSAPSVPSAASPDIASAFHPSVDPAQPLDLPEAAIVNDPELGTKLKLIGSAGGTQGAKWYEDTSTGARWVVKAYKDPNRVATELTSNAVYRQLGIPVAEAVTTTVDGQPVYASREVKGKLLGETHLDELSPDARLAFNSGFSKGFIADAMLASRDVVGAIKDNIVVSDDGTPYRIDVGGTLFYRARGLLKDFGPDAMEHVSMLAGKAGKVYAEAGLDEYTKQQSALVIGARLSDAWIGQTVTAAGFSGKMGGDVAAMLKARRDTLVAFYKPAEPVTREVLSAVEAMKLQGHGISLSGEAFKGGGVHANFELAPDGSKQLVVYGKLRGSFERVLMEKLSPSMSGLAKPASSGGPDDPYFDTITAAAKTINYHKIGGKNADNAFNQHTLNQFTAAVEAMDTGSPVYQHHKLTIETINDNLGFIQSGQFDKVKPVPLVVAEPQPLKTGEVSLPFSGDIKAIQLTSGAGAWVRELSADGLSQRTVWADAPLGSKSGVAIHFETPEVEGIYFPSGKHEGYASNAYSRQGYVELRAKDGTIESMRAGMRRLDIPNHDSTVRDSEEVYLSRMAWWLHEDKSYAYTKAHAIDDPSARLIAKRAALSKLAGVDDITQTLEYHPLPRHDARGTTYYEAPILAGISDNLPDSLNHHLKAGNWANTLNGMHQSGVHSLESTEARLRKGLFISGMSSTQDQNTGGAGHLFFHFGDTKQAGAFNIDGRIMRRLDAYAFDHDAYGNLSTQSAKRRKPGDFHKAKSPWEATIAGGVGFDYFRSLVVDNEMQRQEVLSTLAKMHITHIGQAWTAGGIPVLDGVKVKTK